MKKHKGLFFIHNTHLWDSKYKVARKYFPILFSLPFVKNIAACVNIENNGRGLGRK
jgi:hypothetical protein